MEGSRTILRSRGLALLFAALLAVACSAGGDTRPAGADSTAPSHPLGGGTGRIAYACEVNYKNALLDICTSRLDGSRRVRVTHARTNEFDPTWSPDGKRIAFRVASPSTKAERAASS